MPVTQTREYTVAYDPSFGRDDDVIHAAYFGSSEHGDFVEFKDREHACVFSVSAKHVLCIRRGTDGVG